MPPSAHAAVETQETQGKEAAAAALAPRQPSREDDRDSPGHAEAAGSLTPAQGALRRMVLDAAVSPSAKRHYGGALDRLFALAGPRPLTAALLTEFRAAMGRSAPSTVNVRMAAVRSLVREARRNGLLTAEAAAELLTVPNIPVRGIRMGNWLTREQTRELLQVPDRQTLKGKRDFVILAVLVGCGVRREELATLDVATLQLRDGRWVPVDLLGKRSKVRTVAVPLWVQQGIEQWKAAAAIDAGRLLRSLSKGGVVGTRLSDRALWTIVSHAARAIGVPRLGPHDLRRTCARLCRKAGGDLEQIQMMLGHDSVTTTEKYTRIEQRLDVAVNDNLGL